MITLGLSLLFLLSKETAGKHIQEVWCIGYQVPDSPLPNADAKTSIAPFNGESKYYKYKSSGGKTLFGFTVSWRQRASDFQYIKGGYYIEIYHEIGGVLKYQCDISESTLTSMKLSILPAMIHFNYSGDPPNVKIDPCSTYRFDIQSRPVYKIGIDKSYSVTHRTAKRMSRRSKSCREKGRQRNKARHHVSNAPIQSSSSHLKNKYAFIDEGQFRFLPFTVLGIKLLVIFIVFIGAVLQIRRRRADNHANDSTTGLKRRILIITSCGEEFIPETNKLIKQLEKYGNSRIEVITNLRTSCEISQKGVIAWTTVEMSKTDITIFLINDSKAHTNKNDLHLTVAINSAMNMLLKNCKKNMREKFIAIHLSNKSKHCDSVDFCKHYVFPADLTNILKHSLGPCYSPDCVNIVKKAESEALITNCPIQNDLDKSMTHLGNDSILTFNIPQDEYPSIESNLHD